MKIELPEYGDVYYLASKDWSVFSWDNNGGDLTVPRPGDLLKIGGKHRVIQAIETYTKLVNPEIPAFGLAFKGDWREWDD